jgi:hypothetical protein
MGLVYFIACTGLLIGSAQEAEKVYNTTCALENGKAVEKHELVDDRKSETKGFSEWELPKDCTVQYHAKVGKSWTANSILISCQNGEQYLLPASQCSVSLLDKEKL